MWRNTPQTTLVITLLRQKGHATNQELALEVRKAYPAVSNTTVHRITARLVQAHLATYAPSLGGSKIVDANTTEHDHFLCQTCNRIIDILVSDDAFTSLQEQLPGKLSHRSMLIAGICETCVTD